MNLAASVIRKWRDDPVVMVRDLFGVEPDAWQQDFLRAFPHNPRLAAKACKGPGKTSCLAWIGWNFMLTRPHPMVGCTSITGDNLKANLWTELARWRDRSELLKNTFDMTKTEVVARDHPKTWKMEARSWARDADPTQIGNTLAGVHADYVLWLGDEAGDYPEAVLAAMEGVFSGAPKEAHIVLAGNPTSLTGALYRACVIARELWYVIEITGDPDDPKRSPRIDIDYARAQIKQYGRDNPWVLVSIFGQFPPSAFNALIGPEEVRAAFGRFYREYDLRDSARVLAADVARQGDDQSVISKRQGLQMWPFIKHRNIDGIQGSSIVNREWADFDAQACFVDATGGFGWTWIEGLQRLGRAPIPVEFSGMAHQSDRHFNKRTEMALDFVEWIRRGGALPEDDRLLAALTQTTYAHRGDRLLLEPKDGVKAKIGFSPDEFDSAMMTFAEPIALPSTSRLRPARSAIPTDYAPFQTPESGYRPF